jgi:predicted TIM-barrel enzyme
MGTIFTRAEVLTRLNATIDSGEPIVAAGPANGIAGKCAALGGADLIIYSSLGTSRSMGFPTRAIDDFRGDRSMRIHDVLWEVVDEVPLIAGLDASDIFSLDHERLVDRFVLAGASGVANLPSSQMYGDHFRAGAGATPRHGMHQELQLLSVAHERRLFTVGYAYRVDDALAMIDAGADMIIATCGNTQGGTAGYPEQSYDEALAKIVPVVDAVRDRMPDVLCLGHGGPFNSPEASAVLYERAEVDGIYACSALDRIPIELAVRRVVEEYKAPLAEARAS